MTHRQRILIVYWGVTAIILLAAIAFATIR
jgi:hypothetical protein